MQLINVFILFCVEVYCDFPAIARQPAASCPLNRRPADWIGLVFRANEIFAIWIISGFLRYDRMAHSKDTRTPVIGT